ncbi:MAG: CHAT domain-containing protein [Bacteroidales bacterium]|nr:CHAT domain-containing protein [Bacteroidales bacterium]
MSSPEVVKLFTSDTLKALSLTDIYKTPKLYNILWQPLSKYLKGVKNVYFSPCGLLHTIGIEYLCNKNDEIFSNQYAVYRLTSTRELVLGSSPNTNLKAATFGGITYDYEETAPADTADKRGGGAAYLQGSKEESEAVAAFLRSAKYEIIAFTDTAATEESFKKLSGSGIKILHIGTHGKFYTEEELNDIGLGYLANNKSTQEDKALNCSVLLFAGANGTLSGENYSAILGNSDDGILTAKEISRLDFKGLDLVVLSACQSGLGEITGEGVFGLQRGFKKAGAQTIIMSLWNVFDKATQLLMTEFFKNLSSGMSKRAAFVAAQSVVKQKYMHPVMWAGFVMIDGIE